VKKTSLEVIAPTVEEAIARGAAELGLPKEDLEVEVLDEGGKGFLGLSGRQARVRLSIAIEDRPGSMAADRAPGEDLKDQVEVEAGPQAAPPGTDPRSVQAVQDTVQELITLMDLEAEVRAGWGPADPEARTQPLLVDVRGEDLGILIGRPTRRSSWRAPWNWNRCRQTNAGSFTWRCAITRQFGPRAWAKVSTAKSRLFRSLSTAEPNPPA